MGGIYSRRLCFSQTAMVSLHIGQGITRRHSMLRFRIVFRIVETSKNGVVCRLSQ
jgi:hypothetical protein